MICSVHLLETRLVRFIGDWKMSENVAYNQWADTVSIVACRNKCRQMIKQVWNWKDLAQVKVNTGAIIKSQGTSTDATLRTACCRRTVYVNYT